MWTFTITLLAIFVVFGLILAVFIPTLRKRRKSTHEKLAKKYIYREKPHADQVAEMPNKLRDNEITRG